MRSRVPAPAISSTQALPRVLTCEACLKTLSQDTCPHHPHAERLDSRHSADVEWLAVLRHRRTIQRIKNTSTAGFLAGFLAIFTLPFGGLIWAGMVIQFIAVGLLLSQVTSSSQTLDVEHNFTAPQRTEAEVRMRRIAQYNRRISRTNRSNHSARSNLGVGAQ